MAFEIHKVIASAYYGYTKHQCYQVPRTFPTVDVTSYSVTVRHDDEIVVSICGLQRPISSREAVQKRTAKEVLRVHKKVVQDMKKKIDALHDVVVQQTSADFVEHILDTARVMDVDSKQLVRVYRDTGSGQAMIGLYVTCGGERRLVTSTPYTSNPSIITLSQELADRLVAWRGSYER